MNIPGDARAAKLEQNGAVRAMMTKTQRVVINDDLLRLLDDVARSSVYYEALAPLPSRLHRQLRDLESLGYIRYCPYPEEFWVMLPAGKEFLSRFGRGQES